MENMNVENIVEEVVENIEETMPAKVAEAKFVSPLEATLISAATYLTLKYGGKLVGRAAKKAQNWWTNRKPKTKVVKEDEVFDTPIAEIDEDENK